MEALSEAIQIAGGKAALARALKTSPQTVNNWTMRGRVPPTWAKSIESATSGKITAEMLRPDIFAVRSSSPRAMSKTEAIALFGTAAALSRAIGVTRSAICQWSDHLDQGQSDRVAGAALRLGLADRLPACYAVKPSQAA